MYPHLRRLSVITATLLISLSCPLQVLGNTWGSDAALAQTQTRQYSSYEAEQLFLLGIRQYRQGSFREALDTFQTVLGIFREIRKPQDERLTLSFIGEVYQNLGQYALALEYNQQALALYKKISDKDGEALALNNLGVVYEKLGQFTLALQYFEQALALCKQISEKTQEEASINKTDQLSFFVHKFSRNIQKVKEAVTLNNIGGVYSSMGQDTQALIYFEQALAIYRETDDKSREAVLLSNIGTVYQKQEQYAQALRYFNQSLDISKIIAYQAEAGTNLNNIGECYRSLAEYEKALKYYQQALKIFKKINYKEGEAITLSNIGLTYFSLSKYFDAETKLFAAIEFLEILRSPELKDEQKISIFEQQVNVYRFLQQALVVQNKTNTALEIAERGRARAFVELLASKLPDNLNDKRNIKSLTLQQIQKITKEQNATIVEYSIINKLFKVQGKQEWQQKLYIWVIKPTGEIAFKQVDLNKSLQDIVTSSRDDIGIRGSGLFDVTVVNPQPENSTEKLKQLHKILIAPIADLLPKDPNERVIFIPQESLFLVPFPALQDEQGKYLIEKHTILTAPSIQVLDLTRKQKHDGQRAAKDVLVVGNPTMPKIKIGELVAKLDPLPGAETEAIQIGKFFNTKALTGSKATKTIVMQKMQKARIIHLATHGLLHDFKGFGVPGAIALAPSGTPDDGIDGLLTAGEIFDMKLQADLVVLSACDTGRGNITGDGVVGLSRSLISAGVPSVMVSLWAVNDDSTAFLMTEFYRNSQQNPDKAVALRQAMLTTMKQYPNPKQWAAFTLIGEAN
jgi:CHAT domain-containing protein/Tfp pilus assembly protein PilF